MFSIQYFISDPKTLCFPYAVASLLGTKSKRSSDSLSLSLSSAPFSKFTLEPDIHLENSHNEQQLLAKSKHDF